jgi:hypothetical protein
MPALESLVQRKAQRPNTLQPSFLINQTVIHNVEGSERPNEVGRKYPRSVLIEGRKLVLTF